MEERPRKLRAILPAAFGLAAVLLLSPARAGAVTKSEAELQMEFGVKVARLGAWNEAAFRFEKAVKADGSNPHAWSNLAVALESTGRFDEARSAYEKALALDPGDEQIKANYERFRGFVRSSRKVGDAAD